jgi:hypothetical protein
MNGGPARLDWARRVHLITALVAIAALVLQTGLVISGSAVLAEGKPPDLLTRLGRLVSYFTIQSNLLVAITATQLARDPERRGGGWRIARLAAIVGITATGLVHFFLLRPLLDLSGWDWAADKALHMLVPVLALGSWLAVGPRPRISLRVMVGALAWPILWLAWTLVVGRLSGWYPYPFLDVEVEGVVSVAVVSLAITVLFLLLLAAAYAVDRRLAPQPDGSTELVGAAERAE